MIANCYQLLHITEHGQPLIINPHPLAIHTTQAYSKLHKIILLTIYQLSTDHLWFISSWTLAGWVGLVIIRINVYLVWLD